ncbi:MAG: ABC transporter permease, partial [Cyanobacteria bacterium]|nr:ABC transporter permease [Cyanobacteriota bacterium]
RLSTGQSENVYMLGVDGQSLVGLPQHVVEGNLKDLNTPDAVAIDKAGLKKLNNPKLGDTFEINDLRARVVAIVDVPEGFQLLPYVFTTYDRAKLYSPPERKQLSFVLAKPKPGITIEELSRRIQAKTGLTAMTEDQFIQKTIRYFFANTGIPINFGTTVFLGVLVGAAVAAQTFYTFTIENIKQFATMKAMGTPTGTLIRMVMLQSTVVGMIGLGLGLGLMAIFGSTVPKFTPLNFYTPWQILVLSFVAVVMVSVFSSIFSVWRIIRVDPAIVFRG